MGEPTKKGKSLDKFLVSTHSLIRPKFVAWLVENKLSAKRYGEIAIHEQMKASGIITEEELVQIIADLTAKRTRAKRTSYKQVVSEKDSKIKELEEELSKLKSAGKTW
jgi:uncharacterized 2Fe-2S/4Fe-4S cluster protein (DUF4445 family)